MKLDYSFGQSNVSSKFWQYGGKIKPIICTFSHNILIDLSCCYLLNVKYGISFLHSTNTNYLLHLKILSRRKKRLLAPIKGDFVLHLYVMKSIKFRQEGYDQRVYHK